MNTDSPNCSLGPQEYFYVYLFTHPPTRHFEPLLGATSLFTFSTARCAMKYLSWALCRQRGAVPAEKRLLVSTLLKWKIALIIVSNRFSLASQ